jgi:purine-nucleoside phosphorylase
VREAFTRLKTIAAEFEPRTAVILGSGLARAVVGYSPIVECAFGEIPGMGTATVTGHAGKVSMGHWAGRSVIVFHGRLHFYEGKPWDQVTRTVELAHEFGARTIVLTNAAGGIHDQLNPGDLMAIRGHRTWLHADDFGRNSSLDPNSPTERLFDREWVQRLVDFEKENGRSLMHGIYAALTGPTYETPAEIRALKAAGADAVGMSTVKEAERAIELGMTVIGISCITNKAAGLSPGPLDHAEVLANASAPAERVGRLVEFILTGE